jgi:hypothetical protein
MSSGYVAFVLDAASRQKLLEVFPAAYPETVCHHITHKFDAQKTDVPTKPQDIRVVGCHDGGNIQVLVVEIDGQKMQAPRGDGIDRYYHLTFSLDRKRGAETHHSNDVLRKIVAEKGAHALRNLQEPISIAASPAFIIRDNSPVPTAPVRTGGTVPRC